MREVNFSIPNANKASVGITTALYDRRALDCTSTLPLINSLNHLAYLTTSSARIRDILTIDGGVERLVCILKAGRSREMMEMWKWNLAFQCIVNIGVRGSELVRTRVVEADEERLEDEGVKVYIGVPNQKVHAKICIIQKRVKNRLLNYGFVSTGNMNEKTAGIYADHMLLTSNRMIMMDVSRMFRYLQNPFAGTLPLRQCKTLLVCPTNMRSALKALIAKETGDSDYQVHVYGGE